LRESGYRVLATSSSTEALLLAQTVAIDVLVADGDWALALVDEVRLLQPSTRVLRIAEPDEARNGDLVRPFALDELARMVAHALAD